MDENSRGKFLYLNLDGHWGRFLWKGLEVRQDGALQLASLPLVQGNTLDNVATLSEPGGPAGIAIDIDGTIYFSDPANHKIMKIDGCDRSVSIVPCLGGEGGNPTQFRTPCGLLIPKHRRALMVADSGNHRVQVFDLASWQLVDVWEKPAPGVHSSIFDTPVALTCDNVGNVYVVDSERVQKFNRAGDLVESFWDHMRATGAPDKPKDITVYGEDGDTLIYIIDEATHSIMVFRANGDAAINTQGHPIIFGLETLQKPMGIAVTEDSVYVGDNKRRSVFRFRRSEEYEFVGEAVGYRGPVAALAVDDRGGLLVHSGLGLAPIRLRIGKGYRTSGVLWTQEPIEVKGFETNWLRLRAKIESILAGAQLRLFVHTSNDPTQPPHVVAGSDDPFADRKWRPRAGEPDPFVGVQDLFIGGEPARYLWVGAMFSSDGLASLVLSQLRVEYDHESYLPYLPAIYRSGSRGEFPLRFLALFETFFNDVEGKIENLSALFDPAAVPEEFLPWLAGWLALDLNEEWSGQKRRQVIASAFERYSRRGTVAGLREALRVFAGVAAIIEEPILQSSWWGLPAAEPSCRCGNARQRGGGRGDCNCGKNGSGGEEKHWKATENSILGVTTMLAPAHAQGAVVGANATLDHSHLITDEQFGAPLFEEVAHRFNARVYRGQLRCDEAEALVRSVIEREKPAHTVYHLCIIEPMMRVGFQARVGIDTVVAGPTGSSRLDSVARLGKETVVGGPAAGRIGERSRLGINARVG